MATYPHVRGDVSTDEDLKGERVLEGVVPRVVELGWVVAAAHCSSARRGRITSRRKATACRGVVDNARAVLAPAREKAVSTRNSRGESAAEAGPQAVECGR
jgi:hypothetical protein